MVITYHGGEFFKVVFGDTTLALNPISKNSKLKGTHFGADIALVSADHVDLNGVDQVTHGERTPFVVSGPGEYEVKRVFIKGFASKSNYGEKELINTLYYIKLEGMNLCFLGALGESKLADETKGTLDNIDILFVPIGGEGVLTSKEAHELGVLLEPKIIIPMHHGDIGKKDALKQFLKEEGGGNIKPVEKITLKRKDTEGKEGEVIVLKN